MQGTTLYGVGQLQLAIDICTRRIVIIERTIKAINTEWTISVCHFVKLSALFPGLTAKYQSRVRAKRRRSKRGGSLLTPAFLIDIPAAGAEVDNTQHNEKYRYGRPLLR